MTVNTAPRYECVIKNYFLISQSKHMLCVLKRTISMQGSHINSKTKFHDFSMINNVISMTISSTASNLPFYQHLHHTEHKCGIQQQQYACRPCMHFEIIKNLKSPVARNLAVGHTSVRQLVFWLLVVSSNYFTKLHDFSMIIQIFQIP